VHTLVDIQGALLHICEDHIDLQESFPSTATCYNFLPCSPLFMTHSYYLLEMVRCGKHPTPLAPDYHLRFKTSCLIYPHHLSLSHYCLSWQTAKQSTIHDSIHFGSSSTAHDKLQPEMIPILSLSHEQFCPRDFVHIFASYNLDGTSPISNVPSSSFSLPE
jgi:hypothetical protein